MWVGLFSSCIGLTLEAVTATDTQYQRVQVEIDFGCICAISLDRCSGVDPEVLGIDVNEPVLVDVEINTRLDQEVCGIIHIESR